MSEYVKYPRTFHLPWSLGATSDDKMMADIEALKGREVIITEKMDGENTTMYRDHIHARSVDSKHHPSRDWVKSYWASISHEIPEGYRICGENMFAKHSIYYDQLQSYFLGFSMWKDDHCLSWDETLEWFELIGIVPVPVIYRGNFNRLDIKFDKFKEGYVVRVVDAFNVADFDSLVGKWVRKNHVQTDEHWMHSEVTPNQLLCD